MTDARTGTLPGPALAAIRDGDARYIMGTYARQPIAIERGEGVRVWDTEGREYLDMVGGIAVNVLGHSAPAVRDAIIAQSSQVIHTSNLYHTRPQVRLAQMLVERAFPSRVFFCNSGTEANEAAIKIARKWGRQHRGGAFRIVCTEGSFHGRTLGSLAATGTPRYQEPFAPMPEGFVHVPYNDAEAIAAAVDDRTAAVLIEPIQGESGVLPMGDATLRAVRAICDDRGVLLMLDEVQSGMGRTGRWWAHAHAGIVPDVMTVAKGLGGGVPIGAVLAAPHADVLTPGDHGCTFGGNPLAAAAGAAVMTTIIAERLIENAARVGSYLASALAALVTPGGDVAAVRGRGLMLGVVLRSDIAPRVVAQALASGLIVNATGKNVLRLVPPLTLTKADAAEAVRLLGAAIAAAGTGDGGS